MKPNTTRRLWTAVLLTTICVGASLCYEFVESTLTENVGSISLIGVFIGIVLAIPLAILEDSSFDDRMRRLPFSVAILAKSLTYAVSVLAVFLSTGLLVGILQGLTLEDYLASLAEPDYYTKAATGFVLYVIIVFFRQLDRLLGPGVLLRYVLGRYHQPRRERRIFMFLDLKSSTSLAEALGPATLRGKSESLELVAFARHRPTGGNYSVLATRS